MLVLSRSVGEVIHIGPDIEVMITDIWTNGVRVGITAPDHIAIVRDNAKVKEKPSANQEQSQAV